MLIVIVSLQHTAAAIAKMRLAFNTIHLRMSASGAERKQNAHMVASVTLFDARFASWALRRGRLDEVFTLLFFVPTLHKNTKRLFTKLSLEMPTLLRSNLGTEILRYKLRLEIHSAVRNGSVPKPYKQC